MKGNLLQGTARGRMGEVVGKVVHGKQIFTKYQPNVSNPKSARQKEVREVLSSMSKQMQSIRKLLHERGIKATYCTYAGASKSLQNVVIPFGFKINEIVKAGGNNMKIVSENPLLRNDRTGNDFFLKINFSENALELTSPNPGVDGLNYFGSDTFFEEGAAINVVVKTADSSDLPISTVTDGDFNFALKDRTNAIGNPKQMGFHSSIEAVGEWKYIYQCIVPFVIDLGVEPIDFANAKKQMGALAIVYDRKGRVFHQGFATAING